MILFHSLRSRIYGLAGLLCTATLLLGVLLFKSSADSRDAFRWVVHSQDVIVSLDTLIGDLREGESGLRGYLLSRNETYLKPVAGDIAEANKLAVYVRDLVADNPEQERRARALERLVRSRVAIMQQALGHARQIGSARRSPGATPALISNAKQVMDSLNALIAQMREQERQLLSTRSERVEQNAEGARMLLFIGWPVLALLIGCATWLILTGINRPLDDLLKAVNRFGQGDRDARAGAGGSIEFQGLAAAYNRMADTLVEAMDRRSAAEAEIARANAELVRNARALESRGRSITLVSGMAQRLQAVRADREFEEVLSIFLPQVLPDLAGALYVHNNSRNLLTRVVAWGEPEAAPTTLTPESCWGLRRGKEHVVERPGSDLVCAHARGARGVEQRCEPLLAGGEVLGLVYVEGRMDEEDTFRLALLIENIALALLNEMLRRQLREQSIRDPLTNLFNRRYMEEALALETARALRSHSPVSVIMTDVDHFKKFNDRFGHEAGDALLRAVGGLLQSHFRDGDIVCRYGGEEFIIIAPGAELGLARRRTEALRTAVREMTIDYRGERLGPVTMSFGIDCWDGTGQEEPETMLLRADQALYRAKRLGRDRVELASHEAQVAAA